MSDVTIVALIVGIVGPAAALAGAGVTGWIQLRREDKNVAAAERRDEAAHERTIALRRQEYITETRSKQADGIRAWVSRQLVAQVDAQTFATMAESFDDPGATEGARAAAERLTAGRGDLEEMSMLPAIAHVSDLVVVNAVRAISHVNQSLGPPLNAMAAFLAENPGESWGSEQSARLDALTAEVVTAQDKFHEELTALNKALEDYCAPPTATA